MNHLKDIKLESSFRMIQERSIACSGVASAKGKNRKITNITITNNILTFFRDDWISNRNKDLISLITRSHVRVTVQLVGAVLKGSLQTSDRYGFYKIAMKGLCFKSLSLFPSTVIIPHYPCFWMVNSKPIKAKSQARR